VAACSSGVSLERGNPGKSGTGMPMINSGARLTEINLGVAPTEFHSTSVEWGLISGRLGLRRRPTSYVSVFGRFPPRAYRSFVFKDVGGDFLTKTSSRVLVMLNLSILACKVFSLTTVLDEVQRGLRSTSSKREKFQSSRSSKCHRQVYLKQHDTGQDRSFQIPPVDLLLVETI
jgi:hypothetical protein